MTLMPPVKNKYRNKLTAITVYTQISISLNTRIHFIHEILGNRRNMPNVLCTKIKEKPREIQI